LPRRLLPHASTHLMAGISFDGAGFGGHNSAPPRPSGGGGCRPYTTCWRICRTFSRRRFSPEFSRLGPADCAVVAQVGHPWLAAVLAANLPRTGKSAGVPLKLNEFVGSIVRLAWAKANGCPW